MKKVYLYKDQTFAITVFFNVRTERHPGGNSFHTITARHHGSAWSVTRDDVTTNELKNEVLLVQSLCDAYVDRVDNDPPEVKLLKELGFE